MAPRRASRYTGSVTRAIVLLLLVSSVMAPRVSAQVRVEGGALDQLRPSAPAAPTPTTPARPAARQPVRPAPRAATPVVHATPAHPAPAHPVVTPPRPRPVTVAPAPPPVAVLPPTVEAPPRPLPPAVPVPVLADAVGAASPLPGGVRVTFGAGKSDLNPATADALRDLARKVRADPNVDLNLYSYAAGQPDDPSTPRRLSLSRALAVRAVLMSEGVASTRLYPRALGATAAGGPPDRVDVSSGPPAPPPAP